MVCFTQLIPHAADASFPSDHVAGSFAFAAGTWKQTDRWLSISFTLLAIIVTITRVYTGVHWPTDVIAGALVGIFSAYLMWKLSPFLQPFTDLGLKLFHFGKYAKQIPTKQAI